jgi:hypothetical protein
MPFWTTQPPLHCSIFSDASGDIGYGLVVNNTVYQGLWSDTVKPASSGYKELVPILLALSLLGPEADGRIVIVSTDNIGNVFSINKGSSLSVESHRLLTRIFDLAAERRIYLIGDWVPRDYNTFCDALSKYPWVAHNARP